MTQHEFTERRHTICLTDEQINLIAERASDRAVEKITNQVYREIGRTLLQKFVWVLGALGIGAYIYLQQHGFIEKQ